MNTKVITFTAASSDNEHLAYQAALIWAQAAAKRDNKPIPLDGSQALSGVRRRTALPNSRLVIGTLSGEPAGFTLCSPHDGYLEIYYVAVAPDFWGQGVARELLAEADSYAQNSGVQDLRLWAIADNSRAINLYRANGYRPTGEELTDEASGRVEILLSKEIL